MSLRTEITDGLELLVGYEPTTPCLPSRCSGQLSYSSVEWCPHPDSNRDHLPGLGRAPLPI